MFIFGIAGTPYLLFYKAGMQSGYPYLLFSEVGMEIIVVCFCSVEFVFLTKQVSKAGSGTRFLGKQVSKAGMHNCFFTKQVCSTLSLPVFQKSILFSF